ncbi:protein NCBP2AS2 homolog [Asterias amurensis]|uniref:protein NCBP2AS2 homolog n=1 Tax=Asterias amurensis TaxID=7602 RepID=UPI003AB3E5FB
MPLRFLLRYLANNEQLIEKLAESRIMRRLAQMTAYSINKAQALSHEAIEKASESEVLKKMADGSTDQNDKAASSFSRTFARELRDGMKDIEKEIKKKQFKE